MYSGAGDQLNNIQSLISNLNSSEDQQESEALLNVNNNFDSNTLKSDLSKSAAISSLYALNQYYLDVENLTLKEKFNQSRNNGQIKDFTIINGGLYTIVPEIIISQPDSGMQATASVVIAEQSFPLKGVPITSISIINPGSDYTTPKFRIVRNFNDKATRDAKLKININTNQLEFSDLFKKAYRETFDDELSVILSTTTSNGKDLNNLEQQNSILLPQYIDAVYYGQTTKKDYTGEIQLLTESNNSDFITLTIPSGTISGTRFSLSNIKYRSVVSVDFNFDLTDTRIDFVNF